MRSSWALRKVLRLSVSVILTKACAEIIRLILIHSVGVLPFFFFKASANKADKLGLLFFLTTLDSLIILAIVNTVKYKFRYSPLVQLCFQSTVNTFPCLWYGDSCCGNEPQ